MLAGVPLAAWRRHWHEWYLRKGSRQRFCTFREGYAEAWTWREEWRQIEERRGSDGDGDHEATPERGQGLRAARLLVGALCATQLQTSGAVSQWAAARVAARKREGCVCGSCGSVSDPSQRGQHSDTAAGGAFLHAATEIFHHAGFAAAVLCARDDVDAGWIVGEWDEYARAVIEKLGENVRTDSPGNLHRDVLALVLAADYHHQSKQAGNHTEPAEVWIVGITERWGEQVGKAVWEALQLFRAGDVERNPGPVEISDRIGMEDRCQQCCWRARFTCPATGIASEFCRPCNELPADCQLCGTQFPAGCFQYSEPADGGRRLCTLDGAYVAPMYHAAERLAAAEKGPLEGRNVDHICRPCFMRGVGRHELGAHIPEVERPPPVFEELTAHRRPCMWCPGRIWEGSEGTWDPESGHQTLCTHCRSGAHAVPLDFWKEHDEAMGDLLDAMRFRDPKDVQQANDHIALMRYQFYRVHFLRKIKTPAGHAARV